MSLIFGYLRHHNHDDDDAAGHADRPSIRTKFFRRKDPDIVAGGYRVALADPNTTQEGRAHARHDIHSKGHSAHVPLMTRIKRILGIRYNAHPRRNISLRRSDLHAYN